MGMAKFFFFAFFVESLPFSHCRKLIDYIRIFVFGCWGDCHLCIIVAFSFNISVDLILIAEFGFCISLISKEDRG